jgi:hypothetical protein
MRFRLDHAVLVVDSLATAVRDFTDAGFVVTPGGAHDALPTENALVAFADGSYLELLATRDPAARSELAALRATPRWAPHLHGASAIARRFLPRLAGSAGVGDACLAGERLARFAVECRRREIVVTGPVPMRRERADADALAWELLLPDDDVVPFLIEDRTPRAWRVPGSPAATAHACGATGVAEVFVRAAEPSASALRLADLFDARLEARRDGRTVVRHSGLAWWLEAGEPAGAFALGLAGIAGVPAPLAALGLRAATAEGA